MQRVQLRLRAGLLVGTVLMMSGLQTTQAEDAPPPAMAAAPVSDWDLTDIYATPQAWDDSYAKTRAAADKLGSYKGTLGKSADAMFKALVAISDLNREATRLGTYASLLSDHDLRVAANLERFQQAQALGTRLGESTSWVAPEILKVGAVKVKAFKAANKALSKRFSYFLDNTLRGGPHTLGDEAENILASAGSVLSQPDTLHSQLANA